MQHLYMRVMYAQLTGLHQASGVSYCKNSSWKSLVFSRHMLHLVGNTVINEHDANQATDLTLSGF